MWNDFWTEHVADLRDDWRFNAGYVVTMNKSWNTVKTIVFYTFVYLETVLDGMQDIDGTMK